MPTFLVLLSPLFAGFLTLQFPLKTDTRYRSSNRYRRAGKISLLIHKEYLCSPGLLKVGLGFFRRRKIRNTKEQVWVITKPGSNSVRVLAWLTYKMIGRFKSFLEVALSSALADEEK